MLLRLALVSLCLCVVVFEAILKQLQFFLHLKTKVFLCYMQLQLIIRHGEKSHHTLIFNDGDSLESYYHHVCDCMNLGVDVITFCLFLGPLVFFCPLATLWPIGRWNHIKGDACNVGPLHPIVVKVCGVTKINLPFHCW